METINDGAFIVVEPLEVHPAALIMPPMNGEDYREFKEDILGNGLIEPIILFQGKILDGRNRYNACVDLEIDVWARDWEGGMDPVEYVVSKNIHRRQLTPAQRAASAVKAREYHVQEAKERQRAAGGDRKSVCAPVHEPIDGARADEQAGKLFNVSGRSVAGARVILDHGTEEEIQAIESGAAAIKPVEKQVRERLKNTTKQNPTFNQTTDSIEWAKWTWNPVTGCLHNCPYCYARDITQRYPQGFPNGFAPTFHRERLAAPQNTPLPKKQDDGNRNVFVCSMADLFGEWVNSEWIEQVLSACSQAPDWTFIFLTKNPKRLIDFEFPRNAWVGTTVDTQERVQPAYDAFMELNESDARPTVLFLSCEPMLEELDFGDEGLAPFDWVIIGGCSASTGMPERQPEFDWVLDLTVKAKAQGSKVYWKPNLKSRPREYPESLQEN